MGGTKGEKREESWLYPIARSGDQNSRFWPMAAADQLDLAFGTFHCILFPVALASQVTIYVYQLSYESNYLATFKHRCCFQEQGAKISFPICITRNG